MPVTKTLSALAAATVALLAFAAPTAASAATPGVGDVTDAMIYGADGPVGVPLSLSDEDDDAETVELPFPINFFGTAYGYLCINSNGAATPVETESDTCSSDYNVTLAQLADQQDAGYFAVLASDVDPAEDLEDADGNDVQFDGFGVATSVYYGQTTVNGNPAVAITWYRVQQNDDENDETLANTFQIVLIQQPTVDGDTVGYDLVAQLNFGTIQDAEEGYAAEDCDEDCDRWGIGIVEWIDDVTPPVVTEVFADVPVANLVDGDAAGITSNSLNSAVLGRYQWGIVAGELVAAADPVAPEGPQLAATGAETALPVGLAAFALLLVGSAALIRSRAVAEH